MSNDHISVSPPSAGRIVAVLLGLALTAIALAASLDYSKKEYVSGFLQSQGGDSRVVAPARGRLTYALPEGASASFKKKIAPLQRGAIE